MQRQECEQLTLFQEDFLASHSVQPGSEEARTMTATSGRKCSELYRKSGPLGSLVRTLLVSSAWRSTRCYLTWKASATPAKRLLFRLVPSMPRTEGTELPLLVGTPTGAMSKRSDKFAKGRTPNPAEAAMMFPTITRFDADCGDLKGKEYNGKSKHSMKLIQAAKMFPTPTARCGQTPCIHGEGGLDLATFAKLIPTPTTGAGMCDGSANYQRLKEMEEAGVISAEERRSMAAGNGGQLNPTWVEAMMGFPVGWTELEG